MELKEYEHAKFELSAILRSAALLAQEKRPVLQQAFDDIFARLAEDRFNLAVVGRFSRGKTSLMNALLETESLPTGIVPLTSVITTVAYGSSERAFIEYEDARFATEIKLDVLPDYITQRSNPGNARRVAIARVELPSEILRRGFYFVDTPGLGSPIAENTRTTERFLPQADAFVLVTSYDGPLTEEELVLLRGIASSARPVFLVLNKHDLVSPDERNEVLDHVHVETNRIFGNGQPAIFSVSAREALEANKSQDRDRLISSGLGDFKENLIRFLIHEKQAQFLLRTSERIASVLADLPDATEELGRLRLLQAKIAPQGPNNRPIAQSPPDGTAAIDGTERFFHCEICARIEREMYEFLCRYQYDVLTNRNIQRNLAERGGLCALHVWRYEAIASPRGTCVGFSGVLERLAVRLRAVASTPNPEAVLTKLRKLGPAQKGCDLCRVRHKIEHAAVAEAARCFIGATAQTSAHFPEICFPHLRRVAALIPNKDVLQKFIAHEANMLERVSEDMHRYALKFDGVRRYLASEEETNAARRALILLAGHRNAGN